MATTRRTTALGDLVVSGYFQVSMEGARLQLALARVKVLEGLEGF